MIVAESDTGTPADPVTVEVIRRRLVSIADQVDLNITRTAFSPLVYEYKDYAVGVVDASGKLLAQCTGGMPIFVADVLGAAVRDGLAVYGAARLHEGDIVITNHGGTIGQHLNNVVMYTPVYAPDGAGGRALAAFFVVVVHWLDIGGRVIGSISKHATDIFQEGIQFRTVKLFARGEPVEEMFRMIEYNTRFPDEMMGDIEAQIGGCRMGASEVAAIVERYGLATFRHAIETIWDQSEAAARAVVRAIPDGVYTASGMLDSDGIRPEPPIHLSVKVIVAGDRMTIDLSDLPKEFASPVNAGRSGGGQSVARLAFRYVVIPHEQATEGSFRPLDLVLPEGTMMSASPNAAKGYYVGALPTLIDLVIRALAPALPDRVAGGHYGTFSTVRFVGRLPGTQQLFQTSDSGFGGWGALAGQDGPGPFRTMCHGDTRTIPVEVQEAGYPLRIDRYAIRADSGGAGEFRGGLGLARDYTVLAPCTLYSVFDRTRCPPWGIAGGQDALPAAVTVVRKDGRRQSALRDDVALEAGDRVLIDTGGGGGYGQPSRRAIDRVQDDVRKGYVTAEAARTVYGVDPERWTRTKGVA